MMMSMSKTCGIVLLLIVVGLGGCGESRDPNLPDLVPVTGKITLDGKPLPGATVGFFGNASGSTGSVGTTDADGVYQLQTLNNGEGAPVGQYIVSVSKLVKPDGSDLPTDVEIDPMSTPHKELLPPKYSDMNQTVLKTEVKEGGGQHDFDLKSK